MKTDASLLTLRIPHELKHNIKLVAQQQGISINQLALYALTKEIQALQAFGKLEKYWSGKDDSAIREEFGKILEKIRKKDNRAQVPEWDSL